MPQLRLQHAYLDDVKIHDLDDLACAFGLSSAKMTRPPRQNLTPRTQADGVIDRTRFFDGALFDLTGIVHAATNQATQQAFDQLEGKLTNLGSEHIFRFLRIGMSDEEQAIVKLAGLDVPAEGWARILKYALTLQAQDPRLFSALLRTSTYDPTFVLAGGGMAMPIVFPIVFQVTTSTHLEVVNAGSFETPPRFTITGPVENPIVDNDTTGASLQIVYTLGQNDVVEVDVQTKEVLLNGTSRPDLFAVGSDWIVLEPGTNRIRLRGIGMVQGRTTLTTAWRDAR